MADRTVRVYLQAVTAQYQAAMAKAQASTAKLGTAATGAGSAMSKAGAGMNSTLGRIGSGLNAFGLNSQLVLGGAVVGAFYKSAQAAMEFESSFAGVRKTVDASEAEFEVLAQGMRDLAKEIPVNVNELNRIGEAAGQLGIKKSAILGFTEVVAKMGVTTNLVGDEAATSMARFANIMQMPQDQFDQLGSTIVSLGNAGASTEAEIVDMALRIAGAGAQVGMTEADILAVANALSSLGIEAEMGGSSISRTLVEMQNAVMDGGDALEEFAEVAGVSTKQFIEAFGEDAAGALTMFIDGLGRMRKSGGNVNTVLESLGLGQQRVSDTLRRMTNSGDLFRDSLEQGSAAWKENNALTEEAEKRFDTTASKIELFKNQVNDAAIEIGDVLNPIIGEAASVLGELIEKLTMAQKWLNLLNSEDTGDDGWMGHIRDAAGDAVGRLVPAIGAFRDLKDETSDTKGPDAAADSIKGVGDKAEETSGSLGELGGAQARAAGEAEKHTNKLKEQAEALREVRDAQLSAAGGFLGVQGAASSLQDAQAGLAESERELADLRAKGKKGTKEYRDALRAQKDATLNVLESQVGLADSVNSFISDLADSGVTQRDAIALVREYGAMAGLSKGDVEALVERVKDLIGTYDQLPTEKRTKVTADTAHATSVLSAYRRMLMGIPATISTQVDAIQGPHRVLHAGGVAGSPGPMRPITSLRSDEVPAILQRGEVVLPRGSATKQSFGGPTYNIAVDARGSSMSPAQVKQAVRAGIDAADARSGNMDRARTARVA